MSARSLPFGPEKGNTRNSCLILDDLVWRDLSDDWQKYLLEQEESPALSTKVVSKKSCPNKRDNFLLKIFGLLAESCGEETGKHAFRVLRKSVRCQGTLGGTCDDP